MLQHSHALILMKLLALADIHGAYDRVEKILQREQPYDALVIGGDLTTRGTEHEARDALGRFQRHGGPLFVVAGNMDLPSFDHLFESLGVGINGRGLIHQTVGFFGVSGSPFTPMHTPYEISEQEIAARSEKGYQDVGTAQTTVYVPHAPPSRTTLDRVLLGRHVGSPAVRSFIERRQPNLVICGHIHEGRGIDQIGPSHVVNCGPAGHGYYAVISLGETIDIALKG